MTTIMDNKEMIKRINSVTLCLMAHPDNEPDSEFADRIDDLIEVKETLVKNNVVLADVRLSSLLKKYQTADYNLSKDIRMSFEYPDSWSSKRTALKAKITLLEELIEDEA